MCQRGTGLHELKLRLTGNADVLDNSGSGGHGSDILESIAKVELAVGDWFCTQANQSRVDDGGVCSFIACNGAEELLGDSGVTESGACKVRVLELGERL